MHDGSHAVMAERCGGGPEIKKTPHMPGHEVVSSNSNPS